MADFRRFMVILAVAVLYAVLVFTTIEAVYPNPQYNDFCDERTPYPEKIRADDMTCPEHNISQEELDACHDSDGQPDYKRDAYGCVTGWECSTCRNDYDEAREVHNMWQFIISALMGVLAIIAGLMLPEKKKKVNEWIGSGFMLGGVLALFVGTAMYFGDLNRLLRPIVIFLELVLVIFLAYKKFK